MTIVRRVEAKYELQAPSSVVLIQSHKVLTSLRCLEFISSFCVIDVDSIPDLPNATFSCKCFNIALNNIKIVVEKKLNQTVLPHVLHVPPHLDVDVVAVDDVVDEQKLDLNT